MNLQNLPQYRLIEKRFMKEMDSTGYLLRHEKSGARVFLMENEDNNKVFDIAFRTPPKDSTGVAHIIEHTVLCGSDKYPAKDPFVELVKGSMNTFLNAMTYPDKTMYPLASTNDRDFQNLMSVYMDAVFHPNIVKNEKIFMQEGWHYELESVDAPLTYNGVVYNEMKGEFSSPDSVLDHEIQAHLYPDTTYAVESGGDPECIPDLTYEQYLAFYHRYYHPSNSYIYLYGNMDMEACLNWMDQEYLSNYDEINPESEIELQKPFEQRREYRQEYGITEDEEEEDGTYLAWARVTGSVLDPKMYLAFQILEYVLLDAPGAIIKKALSEKGIGKEVYGGYDSSIQQTNFSIIAKNASEDQKEEFESVIQEVLESLVKNGINKRSLLAGLNGLEFKLREADYGRYPKGLMYGLQCFDSWLYDENDPFMHLEFNETFEFLKNMVETDYFENLIRDWLLENTHGVLITLVPKAGLAAEMELKTAEKLEAYQKTLTEAQLQEYVKMTQELKAYQEEPTPQEILEMIPMLDVKDIRREVLPFQNEERSIEGIPVLFHPIFTSGIGYADVIFNGEAVTLEEFPYLSLLKTMLGTVDTEHYSYQDLMDEMNIHTGGIAPGFVLYRREDSQEDDPILYFSFRIRALYEKLPKAMELLEEMINHSSFEDEKRLKVIIGEMASRKQASMQSAGHNAAVTRSASGYSKSAYFSEMTGGIAFYRFLTDLDKNFEERKEGLKATLKALMKKLFTKSGMMMSFTSDEEGYLAGKPAFAGLLEKLPDTRAEKAERVYPLSVRKEAFGCSSQVQYVARTGNFKKKGFEYTGALQIIQVMMNYEYLWVNIRVKGGAYGCMSGFGRDGDSYFVSYRDPKLRETNEIYNGIGEFLKHAEISDRDMTKYIIGTISEMDVPKNPSALGARSLAAWMTGITLEQLQKERNQILDASLSDIHSLADLVDSILSDECLCVVGNMDKIKKEADLFDQIEPLF